MIELLALKFSDWQPVRSAILAIAGLLVLHVSILTNLFMAHTSLVVVRMTEPTDCILSMDLSGSGRLQKIAAQVGLISLWRRRLIAFQRQADLKALRLTCGIECRIFLVHFSAA